MNLGKFGEGFVTGLATSIDESIQEDMDMFAKKKSRLGDLALEKGLTEQTRFDQDHKKNLKLINELAAKLDTDVDTIQYLYDDEGSMEAVAAKVTRMIEARDRAGGKNFFDPVAALQLQQRTSGKTTAEQLANYVTTPVSLYNLEAAGDIRPGFMKFFGSAERAMDSLQESSEADLAAAGVGIGKTSISDMPAAIEGKGLYEWQLSLGGNPATDYSNMGSIVQQLAIQHAEADNFTLKKDLAKELAAANSAKLIAANKMTLVNNFGKRLTGNEAQDVRNRSITDFAQAHGVGGSDEYSMGLWVGSAENVTQKKLFSEATDILMGIYNESLARGVDPVIIENAVAKARRLNKVPILNKDTDTFVFSDEELFDVNAVNKKGENLFPASPLVVNVLGVKPPIINQSAITTNNASQSSASVSGSIATQNAIDLAVQAARKAKTVSIGAYKQAILDIMDYTNPATGNRYTKAEAEALL